MIFCFTVDDVCLDGYSSEAHLENLLGFLDMQRIKATFFTVPLVNMKPLSERQGYVEILKMAISEGHEVGLHGLVHDRFEFGIPPKMVLDLPHEGPARERLSKERDAIEASLQVGLIRQRLAAGRTILEDALGVNIRGFRAPCLAICDNLFEALDAEGFCYDSSRHMQEAGWDILNGVENIVPQEITRKAFEMHQYPGRMHSLPLTSEYTWYLPWKNFDVALGLAKHDFRACIESAIPFVPICHVSPIQEGEGDSGFEFYRRLLDFARDQANSRGEKLDTLTLTDASKAHFEVVGCA